MTRKILYSPGFGAGWTTWNSGDVAKYMLTYQPIIKFLEKGGKFEHGKYDHTKLHPLLKQLQKECKEKFGENYVCVLGAYGLEVATISGLIKITEYDGSESIICKDSDDEGWQ